MVHSRTVSISLMGRDRSDKKVFSKNVRRRQSVQYFRSVPTTKFSWGHHLEVWKYMAFSRRMTARCSRRKADDMSSSNKRSGGNGARGKKAGKSARERGDRLLASGWNLQLPCWWGDRESAPGLSYAQNGQNIMLGTLCRAICGVVTWGGSDGVALNIYFTATACVRVWTYALQSSACILKDASISNFQFSYHKIKERANWSFKELFLTSIYRITFKYLNCDFRVGYSYRFILSYKRLVLPWISNTFNHSIHRRVSGYAISRGQEFDSDINSRAVLLFIILCWLTSACIIYCEVRSSLGLCNQWRVWTYSWWDDMWKGYVKTLHHYRAHPLAIKSRILSFRALSATALKRVVTSNTHLRSVVVHRFLLYFDKGCVKTYFDSFPEFRSTLIPVDGVAKFSQLDEKKVKGYM